MIESERSNPRFEIPLGARLGLGTQPRYKAPGGLQVKI